MTACNYLEQLESAVHAAEIHNSGCWSWFWEREAFLTPKLRRSLPRDAQRAHLVHTLQQKLYSHFYSQGLAIPAQTRSAHAPLASSKAIFINELSVADKGNGYLDHGWEVIGKQKDKLTIEKSGFRFSAKENECVSSEPGPVAARMTVSRRMPKELRFLSPGFFMALGDEELPSGRQTPIVRFYWNLRPEGAAPLMQAVTTKLNEARVPFRLKVLDHPSQFTRCDAAVLYTTRDQYGRTRKMLEAIYGECAPYLKSDTPVFTKRILPGLGMAESPPNGASFGQHRCQILAEGIVRAFDSNKTVLSERMAIVRGCFVENAICLEKPYLNPGSEDIFDFHAEPLPARPKTALKDSVVNRETLLQTAREIGEIIVHRAVWHGGRCNWLGVGSARKSRNNLQDSSNLVYHALGPEVYAGTAGIALFLAELFVTTRDPTMRRVSLGAIRQALTATQPLSAPGGFGLYDGALGIAMVAAYIGRMLGEEDLLEGAARLVQRVVRQPQEAHLSDLISGDAGGIVALLILKEFLDDGTLTEFAMRLGKRLLENADRKTHCSWKSLSFPKQKNLLGLSHGTAGIACALLELYRATQNPAFREHAESAFRYEEHWYDARANNWPDFRGVPAHAAKRQFSLPTFWCHGAPGIALSRLRAYTILKDQSYRLEALTALTTTQCWTEKMLGGGPFNFSLCHGLGGNADILATGSQVLGEGFSAGTELALKVATAGIAQYARQQHQWPFDAVGSRSPGLMLGLSGVGHFYLRLYDPEVPSVLLPAQDALLRRSAGKVGI